VYTLNLIIHGLFAIVEEPYRLVIAVPWVDDHHYQLGVQAGDPNTDIKPYGPGTYEVTGIQGGSMVFDPAQVAKVENTTVLTTAPPARSVFVLPCPRQIHHCHLITRSANCKGDVEITGTDSGEVKAESFPLITVLTYEFSRIDNVRITGMPEFHAQFKPGSQEFVNVTLFAANPGGHPTGRTSEAFSQMMRSLIPNKRIGLYLNNPDASGTGTCTMPGLDQTDLDKLLPRIPLHTDDCISLFVNNTRFNQ
jgi:hypothetical protein